MKTQTKKLIETKSGSISKNVINALLHCRFDSDQRKIYTGYYNGSGKWATRASSETVVTSILKAQGYRFTTGNDAPQRGIKGDFVKVSKTAFNFILNILK